MMNQGKVNGYICQGFNPVASFPNKNKVVASVEAEVPRDHRPAQHRNVHLLAKPR
jgi:hypothetical protein